MIKTSESFRGFVKCPRNRIKEPSPGRGLGVQRAKRGAERRCSGALPRSTQEGDTGEGSGSAKGEGKLAVANRSGEQWQRRHPSKSAAHDRPPTRHIKRKSGSEQTCDAGLTLRLGPYFLSNCPGKHPGIDRADLEFSMSGNDCGIQIARRNHKTETGM